MQGIPCHSDLPTNSRARRASPTDLRIEPVSRSSQLGDFIRVPIILYGDHPSFVAPINYEVRHRLNPRSNPYFDHADVQLWVAYRGSRPVGRISAISSDTWAFSTRSMNGRYSPR